MSYARRLMIAAAVLSVATAARAQAPAAADGKAVFQKWCAPCHGSGLGKPGSEALQAKYKGAKPALLEERTDLTAETVKTIVRTGIYTMPPFRKTEISDPELDLLAAYLARNTSGGEARAR